MTCMLLLLALGCGLVLGALSASAAEGDGVPLAPLEKVELPAVYLYDGPAPGAKGSADEDRPRLSILRADPKDACGTAVIVCPGGGYNVRAMDYEGLQVARWLNSLGIDAFLLSYRVGNAGYTPDDAFTDGVRAVRYVRYNAAEHGVDPKRIGMVGFSAGAHLSLRVATDNDAGGRRAADPVERESSRPDFVLLIYTPGITWGRGEGTTPPASEASLPPAFIFHTANDQLVPVDNALETFRLWKASGAEAELHVFGGYGPHGVGLASGLPGAQDWPMLAASWMRRGALLTGKERVSVEGQVSIDGASSGSAWVTFIPVDSDHDPVAAAATDLKDGTFRLDTAHGPVTGRHRVEVRQYCRQFLAFPSQTALYTYVSARPGGGPIPVDLHPGRNEVTIAISTE